MLLITTIYLILVWLLFSKLRLVRWSWMSGSLVVLLGVFILAAFLALFNYLTPSGSFVVVSRVIEVTPNVSGQVVDLPARTNVPIKAGTVLFRMDPTPYAAKVRQLEASLAQACQQVGQLRASYDQATANVEGLTAQLAYNRKRLVDIQNLAGEEVSTLFKEQDNQVQVATVFAQLAAAKATQLNAKLALDSQIGGVNTTVAQIEAELDHARWDLEQTTVRAPGNGYVTLMALADGDRAVRMRSVMSFVLTDEIKIVGMFKPNGFQTVKPGATVKLVFYEDPGRIYHAMIEEVPLAVGEGQVAVSGILARARAIHGANVYPAQITIPAELQRDQLRPGMPGSATVFADNAGVIGLIMSILVWVESYTAYL